MTNYIYPTAVHTVSDSFADHVARTPTSVNPGTDYEAPTGSDVWAVAAGVVTDADGNPDGSGGRTVHIDHDDGTGTDYLHLNALGVSVGQRVVQGQRIGFSGASGNGSNTYYGPHLHISFRRNHSHGYWNDHNEDFDAIVRSQTSTPAGGGSTPIPTPKEFDMPAVALHQVNSKPNASGVVDQAYLEWTPFSLNTVSFDYAAALNKANGKPASDEGIQKVNENDVVAIRHSVESALRAIGK